MLVGVRSRGEPIADFVDIAARWTLPRWSGAAPGLTSRIAVRISSTTVSNVCRRSLRCANHDNAERERCEILLEVPRRTKALFERALELPLRERAELAREFLDSLENFSEEDTTFSGGGQAERRVADRELGTAA